MRLSAYPYVVLRIGCEKCGRHGQYNIARLAEKHGAEILLPFLRHEIVDCERLKAGKFHDLCGARFIDLGTDRGPDEPPAEPVRLTVVR